MPTVAQVDVAVRSRFGELEGNTCIAPLEKFVMLTFQSAADARAAHVDLPAMLRKHLQKHAAYAITATLMSVSKGRQLIKDAAQRRRRKAGAVEAAGAGAEQWGAPAEPSQVPMHAAAAAPAWPHVQPAAPMYVQAGMPIMGPAAPPVAMPQAALPVGAGAAAPQQSQPLPSGFLHSFGPTAAPAGARGVPAIDVAPPSSAVLGPAAEQPLPHVDVAPQQSQPAVMPDFNNLAAILQSAGSKPPSTAEAQANAPEADAMLGLLQQLGSTQQG